MMPDWAKDCGDSCERMPVCGVCGHRKKPVGRHAGAYASTMYCDDDCPGYRSAPTPGHLWPGELEDMRAQEQG